MENGTLRQARGVFLLEGSLDVSLKNEKLFY